MYRIREVDPFQDEDALEAIHFFNRLTSKFPALDQETLDRGWWWLAWDWSGMGPSKPVGFCGLTRSTSDNHTGYFKRAAVDPKHRGHGLQSRMIQVRIAKARKLGFTRIVTDTTDTVYSANNLYKAGFKMYEPEFPWMPYKTSLYWVKIL